MCWQGRLFQHLVGTLRLHMSNPQPNSVADFFVPKKDSYYNLMSRYHEHYHGQFIVFAISISDW